MKVRHIADITEASPSRTEVTLLTFSLSARFDLTELTDDERRRAASFRHEPSRVAFITGRTLLRRALAVCLNCRPDEAPITYLGRGKPILKDSNLHFNLSHAGDYGVIAITWLGPVGVDIERQKDLETEELVKRFFAPNEATRFACLPPEAKRAAFFRAWTRKEAILKATGTGVTELDRCEVTFEEGIEPKILAMGGDPEPERWRLHAWTPATGYEAAVVVRMTSATEESSS